MALGFGAAVRMLGERVAGLKKTGDRWAFPGGFDCSSFWSFMRVASGLSI